jgi:hypothetical protein
MALPSPDDTPAAPRVDHALDAQAAMLFCPKAPLAEATATDRSAVWACVPPGHDVDAPRVLVYFHGHNYFVTAAQSATKAGSRVVARAPDWLSGRGLSAATLKGAAQGPAGSFYKFDALASMAGCPSPPLVLLPEDSSEDATYDPSLVPAPTRADPDARKVKQGFWARESSLGTLADPTTLGEMIDDCLDRLTRLSPTGAVVATPGTGSYLAKALRSTEVKRLFLTGHSGGGVPLFTACARARMALTQATSLWAFDATYGHPAASVRSFCEAWEALGRLGMGPDDSRVVLIYNPASETQPGADEVRDDLRSGGPGGAGKKLTVQEVGHAGARDLPAVEAALRACPIVIIRTNVAHDAIPQTFTPILLRNA